VSTYKRVPVESLYVDDRYQRPVDQRRISRMAKQFDERLVGTLEVSQRNGTGSYAVFDGQHRLEAAKLAQVGAVPCLVHKGLSPTEEADLFVTLQRQRKNITPLERFHARVFTGDETALMIEEIAEACGFEIATYSRALTHDTLRAIVAVERIYKRGNLAETLTLLRELWAGDDKSTDGALLEGLSALEDGYGHRLTEEVKDRLREVAPAVILRRAMGPMRGGGPAMAALVASEMRKVARLSGRPRTHRGEEE
jgi:hypothetical protein